MTARKVFKACIDYMFENDIYPEGWKVTEKNLVWYDFENRRHQIPLKNLGVA